MPPRLSHGASGRLHLVVAEAELERLRAAADSAGQTVSAYVREAIRDRMRADVEPEVWSPWGNEPAI